MLSALALLAALVVPVGLASSPAAATTPAAPAPAAPAPDQLTLAEMVTENSTYIPEVTLAATGCGSSCDYKNPATYKIYTSGCSTCYYYCNDDARDQLKVIDPVNSIILRYSPRCRTAWAKTTYSNISYIKAESRYLSGTHRATVTEDVGNYTVMLNDADLQARACVQPTGPYGLACTGWY
ncbi:DUF2690 domain-containing protein [Micromonospora sp. NPDC023956]|uniref:DUF2690 domain-containing protein n=1 Tax=Micromonospora sp. NPDC023956 TaxID=3155722 RepID=UPI0033F64FDF